MFVEFICFIVLSPLFYIMDCSALIIMMWGWFIYDTIKYVERYNRHEQYIKEKMERNKRMGFKYID